jgi:neutral ceramidase
VRGVIGGLLRGAAAVGLAVLLCAGPAWSAARASADAGLKAGAASIDVALPEGVPLGGYGGFPRRAWLPDLFNRYPVAFWFRPSIGVHDPFKVRSLVLESGSVRVLWLSVDLIGVDPGLVSALRQRLASSGIGSSAIIASASHTHSGPGAFGESEIFALVAIDRLSLPVRDRILDGLERAARAADAGKAPARVATGRAEVRGIAESRVQQPLDPELGVLRVTRPDGRPVALVWNYAIHGTALGRENFLLSNDLMGEASALLERQTGAPALFVNGAVGDVSPRRRGWPGVKEAGAELAAGALRALEHAAPEPGRIDVVAETVALPGPTFALRNCLNGWAPGWMAVGLREVLPTSTEVLAVSIGRTGWVTIPGELETRLGLEVKGAARRRFDGGAFIAGVSNDYLGYFLAAADYRRPSYIACGSLYGERGGDVMRDAAIAALERAAAARDRR